MPPPPDEGSPREHHRHLPRTTFGADVLGRSNLLAGEVVDDGDLLGIRVGEDLVADGTAPPPGLDVLGPAQVRDVALAGACTTDQVEPAGHGTVVEAGGDLYAATWQTFRRVTLPLSMPGVVLDHPTVAALSTVLVATVLVLVALDVGRAGTVELLRTRPRADRAGTCCRCTRRCPCSTSGRRSRTRSPSPSTTVAVPTWRT